MATFEIILGFVQELVWPAVVLVLVYTFRRDIRDAIPRVKKVTGPGGVAIDLTEQDVALQARLAERVDSAASPEEKVSQIREVIAEGAVDRFEKLCLVFFTEELEQRKWAAAQIEALAPNIGFERAMRYLRSPQRGQRVGGAIAVRALGERDPAALRNPGMVKAARSLLGDPFERVRFRAYQLVFASKTLSDALAAEVREALDREPASMQRQIARLKRATDG